MAEAGRKKGTGWPSWRYGPDEQAQVFQSEDDVPKGWEDHPSKVGKAEAPKTRRGRKPKAEAPDEPMDL